MNYLQELKKLGQLKNDGKLTEEEFQEKKEKILSQSSKTKGNKTESGNKKKKGFFESAFEKTLDNRLEKVTKLYSTDQEALKEWKKYKRQYKNKKITLTALRKKAKEIKSLGFRLTKSSIDADLASLKLAITLQSSAKSLGIKGELGRTRKGWGGDSTRVETNYWDDAHIYKRSQGNRTGPDTYTDRPDGKWTYWSPDGKESTEFTWKNGEMWDGVWIGWLENGQKSDEGTFKDGKQDGKWSYWSPDGKESTELTWKNGEPWDGVWIDWYENGKKNVEKTWKDGKLINEVNYLKNDIIELLKERGTKMPASDIDAHLKHQNIDEIKELCEEMYHNGEINRTGNYRYFVLTKKESKPTKSKQVDIGKELKKYKDLLDQELITQDDYDAKKKELLGL
jgi:hypothetical protein